MPPHTTPRSTVFRPTVFEKRETLGGIVRNVIPGFRIGDDAIDNDIALIKKTGAEFVMGKEAPDVKELKAMGFDYIVLGLRRRKEGPPQYRGQRDERYRLPVRL